MKSYKHVANCDVWPHLQAGRAVYAVVFESRGFRRDIYNARKLTVESISQLLNSEDTEVVFYERAEE